MNSRFFCDAINYLLDYPRLLYALWRIGRLKKPIVTIFGGKGAQKDSEVYKQTAALSQQLAQYNYSVITGGGPGVMESALCAVREHTGNGGQSLGIGVKGVDDQFKSACEHETIFLPTFAARKWLLIRYSIACVVFPGGIGTLDEWAEVLNLIKTNRIQSMPVIFVGSEFWKPVMQWVQTAIEQGFIDKKIMNVIIVTDNIEQVLERLEKECIDV